MRVELGRRDFLKTVRDAIPVTAAVLLSPQNTDAQESPLSPSPLDIYLGSIALRASDYELTIIKHHDLFSTADLSGFQNNYPFYFAGEEQYQTPWLLLFITHKEESTYSTDPLANTDKAYKGGMQRSNEWPDSSVIEAAAGWEFLADFPRKLGLVDDWKEILWAASYFRKLAKERAKDPDNPTEEDFLDAQKGYCDPKLVPGRIAIYRSWKQVLTPDNPAVSLPGSDASAS